jgi:hypothetical protein
MSTWRDGRASVHERARVGDVETAALESAGRKSSAQSGRGSPVTARWIPGMSLSARLMAAMVALVLVTAAAVGLLTYRNIDLIALPQALHRIEMHSRLAATELEASLAGAQADVHTQGRAVQGMVRAVLAGGRDPLDGNSEVQWRNSLAARFVASLTANPSYLEFALVGIADGGREIARVRAALSESCLKAGCSGRAIATISRRWPACRPARPISDRSLSSGSRGPSMRLPSRSCRSRLPSLLLTASHSALSISASICVPHSLASVRMALTMARSTW